MIVIKDTEELKRIELVATVGFFDGVHLGHRFLIERMKEIAHRQHLPTAVITFSQHPRKVLHTDYQPKLLNSFPEKIKHLEETGIDYCIVLDFTIELSKLTAKEFICDLLAVKMHVKTLCIGYDHRFGHDRTEGFEQYVSYGATCNMNVLQIGSYEKGKVGVSSSEIRRQLMEGYVEKASKLLTYPYQIKGSIVSGYKMGRTLGFPTANIQLDEPFKVIPALGVYAVRVYLEKKSYVGMLYIGNRPTLNNGDNITLEVNILNFEGDIYNKEINVAFIEYIRGNVKFDSIEQLKEQISRDREEVMRVMSDER